MIIKVKEVYDHYIVTRREMIARIKSNIKDKYDINLSSITIARVLKAEEEEILKIIAMEEAYKMKWGWVGGRESVPKALPARVNQTISSINNHGFSVWKRGYPFLFWTKTALVCEKFPAQDYYEQDSQVFTTEARLFRKVAKLPELEEFNGLTETEIYEINKKADNVNALKKDCIDKAVYQRRIRKARKWLSEYVTGAILDPEKEDVDYVDNELNRIMLVYQDIPEVRLKVLQKRRYFIEKFGLKKKYARIYDYIAMAENELRKDGIEPPTYTEFLKMFQERYEKKVNTHRGEYEQNLIDEIREQIHAKTPGYEEFIEDIDTPIRSKQSEVTGEEDGSEDEIAEELLDDNSGDDLDYEEGQDEELNYQNNDVEYDDNVEDDEDL